MLAQLYGQARGVEEHAIASHLRQAVRNRTVAVPGPGTLLRAHFRHLPR